MIRHYTLLSAVAAAILIAALPAAAQAPAPKAEDSAKPAPATAAVSPVKEWIDAENALIDPLNDLNRESIFIMRNKYSTVRTIEIVERDIGNAVAACGKANPDMKARMDARFAQWKKAVSPVIETAKENLNREVDTQTIVDVAAFKRVLKLNDAAYKFSESQTTKEVVTEKTACEGLLASMDETEDQMISLLREILLPASVIRKREYKRPPTETRNFSADGKAAAPAPTP